MSRSYKKTPALCWAGETNKKSKKECNRKFRKESKRRIALDEEPLYDLDEACNVYDFDRDGLARYINKLEDKYLRK